MRHAAAPVHPTFWMTCEMPCCPEKLCVMFCCDQVVSNEARARSQRMTEAAAARIAELTDQVERQQRALT